MQSIVNFFSSAQTDSILDLAKANCNDIDLERAICQNIPEKTYQSIQVYSCKKKFLDFEAKDVRVIMLKPSGDSVDELVMKLQKLFKGLHNIDKPYRRRLMGSHIMGSSKTEESEVEIRRACSDKRELRIFISVDLDDFYTEIEEDRNGLLDYCIIQ